MSTTIPTTTEREGDGYASPWWPEAKVTDKRCIQCGAKPNDDGTLPCNH